MVSKHFKSASAQKKSINFSNQGGIALIISLLVLVVMLLAGVAIVRSSLLGQGVTGNIGFKQNATSVADQGVEQARAWLMQQAAAGLETDQPDKGFYSTWVDGFDPITANWSNANSALSTQNDGTGNEVRYMVHRMCQNSGPVYQPSQSCVGDVDDTGNMILNPSQSAGLGVKNVLYRVTAKVMGVRGTVSYIQVMLR